MTSLYPLTFTPILKEKIWGGNKLVKLLGKSGAEEARIGESWEISGVAGNVSRVDSGSLAGRSLKDLIEEYGESLVGPQVFEQFGTEFPLLIKFIDAKEDLSVQVHPDDDLALKKSGAQGKTEMWYVMQADPGARLIAGFNQETDAEDFKKQLNNGTLQDLMRFEDVNQNDYFFIPAGRIHTIGKGILLAEIQQTSDVTYRVYDFDRKDDHGNLRPLHVEDALEALDFQDAQSAKRSFSEEMDSNTKIVDCPYFTTHVLNYSQPATIDLPSASFHILIGVEGSGVVQTSGGGISISAGDCVLIPAAFPKMDILPNEQVKILMTFVGNN